MFLYNLVFFNKGNMKNHKILSCTLAKTFSVKSHV